MQLPIRSVMELKLSRLFCCLAIFPSFIFTLNYKVPGVRSQEVDLFRRTFFELITGPLKNDNILLISDAGVHDLLDLTVALEAFFPPNPILIGSQEYLLNGTYHSSFIRGSLLTALLIFQEDPATFLDQLEGNAVWNPKYLVIWVMNKSVNPQEVISHPVLQRSEHIFLLKLNEKAGVPVFEATTSYPMGQDSRGKNLILSPLGFWNSQNFSRRNIFPSRYSNFNGKLLELASWCDDTPFVYAVNGTCKGAMLDALTMIGSKYNFTFEPQFEPVDQRWGSIENGTWVGMLGDLVFNDKHLVLNDFSLDEEVARDFDFTYPYHAEGFGILVRLPKPKPKWQSLLYPFTKYMWASTILTTFLVSTILSGVLFCLFKVNDPTDITFKIMGGVVRQSISLEWVPPRHWIRVWLVTWWLAVIIISSVYTSNLIAVLTVPVYPKRVETLEELAASAITPWLLDYGTPVPEALRTSNDPTLATLGEKLVLAYYDIDHPYNPFFETLPVGKFALIETFYYLNNLQLSFDAMDISYIMKAQLYYAHLAWFLPKNTPYTNLISSALQSLREAGIVDQLFYDHMANMRNLAEKVKLTQQSRGGGVLSIDQLQGAFLLWILGLVIAALVFFLEEMFTKLKS